MASNDNLLEHGTGRSSKIWPTAFIGLLVAFTLVIYYGSQFYIGWRYRTTVNLGLLDGDVWVDLLQRLPPLFQAELALVGIGVLGFMIGMLRPILAGWKRSRQKPSGIEDLHGSARWATREEILASGLLPFKRRRIGKSKLAKPFRGVVIGGWQEGPRKPFNFLKDDSKSHILAFAPTRSGKGVSLVLPTLLDGWRESALVYDPKGEAWALTAGFRQSGFGHRVYKFDPAGTGTDIAKFNPLAEIRVATEHEVADCQNVAQILVDPEGKGLDDHWDRTANALLAAVILHVCYVAHHNGTTATFGDVERWFGDPGDAMEEKLKDLTNYPHLGKPGAKWEAGRAKAHPMIASEARSNLDRADKERSSVISTALSHLTLYRDPTISENTGRSDWTISDLIDGDVPATVYFVVRPADQERLRPLIRLILTQIVRRLTRDMEFKAGQGQAAFKHRLLLLLDEFTSLKRLTIIEETLPYMAGYGVKCMLICQDLQQLLAVYGREESLVGNCNLRVCFAPNRIETAELISKWAGDMTIVAPRYSRSGKRSKIRADSVSESMQEHRRRLILPDEVMRLPGAKKDAEGNITEAGDMLIFAGGARPIYGKQPLYFKYPELARRANLPVPEHSDTNDPRTLKHRAQQQQNLILRTGGASGAA